MDDDLTASAQEKLLHHAGLSRWRAADYPLALSDALKTASAESLELAGADLVSALQELNLLFNGSPPSESLHGVGSVSREVAYAVSECLRMLDGLSRSRQPEAALSNVWRRRIDIAWNAVLAGDVDDLREHIELTEAMESLVE